MRVLNHTPDDLKRIKENLINSFINDVMPLYDNFKRVTRSIRLFPFGIIRQVMPYIDVSGAIYKGWEAEKSGKFNTKKVATSGKSIAFIKDKMGKIDAGYNKNGGLFYKMYRHGTIHLIRPLSIKNTTTGELFTWKLYWGNRKSQVETDGGIYTNVQHLELIRTSTGYELPVSIECLYKDTKQAINDYFDELIELRKKEILPLKQRMALTFITEGYSEINDI